MSDDNVIRLARRRSRLRLQDAAVVADVLAGVCRHAQRGDFFGAGFDLGVVRNMKLESSAVSGRRHEICDALQEAIYQLQAQRGLPGSVGP